MSRILNPRRSIPIIDTVRMISKGMSLLDILLLIGATAEVIIIHLYIERYISQVITILIFINIYNIVLYEIV